MIKDLFRRTDFFKFVRNSTFKNFSSKPTLFEGIFGNKDSKAESVNENVKLGVCNEGCKDAHKHGYSEVYSKLLEGNKKYVSEKTEANPTYFSDLAKTQTPKYLLIGCSDSRVPPNEMTKTEPGEIFIHRNIANQVIFSDLNCMSVLQFSIEHLKVSHVIVMGHTKCGGVIASRNKTYKGLIENWLQNIKDVALMNKEELDMCTTEDEYLKKLTVLNVKAQVLNVCKTPYVQKAWAEGRDLHIHGWLMNIETGLIQDLGVTNKDWNKIKKDYDFDFNLH